ncbi:serine hydrolase domain-containing protein [Massilia yuzhufengensis]|uniref:CubicO group peptidase, beta-lactamase class C family n=1 Tax=Massilia yuzhufengensis TaxID=1164594 RepID=A0A1I1D7X9_9BURK|nr:serine hydrolase [Massilia yuzhufengensis]SFB70436.1 CubicO group peptidase, beta-lactamase class C family [Massilia yuzhufengensis]
MNERRRSLLGMALLGAVEPLFAAPASSGGAAALSLGALDAELAGIVNDPAMQLASLSVVAIRAGQPVYEQAFGRRFIGANGLPDQPATPATLFRIASISKMMTTLGLMRLVEAGRIDLDADVSRYLGFSLRNPHFPQRAITLRTLLTHTSSLRDEGGYSWPLATALKDVLAPGAPLYGEGTMWAQRAGPGEYFTYCNLGWGVIGTVMEAVTGERFDLLMQRLLLQPLGVNAGYNPSALPPAALGNLATLYRKRTTDTEIWNAQGPWIPQVDDYSVKPPAPPAGIASYVPGANATPFSPTGGLRISARDMGVVMRMLMNGGVHGGQRLLQRATLERMFARQWTHDGIGANGDSLGGFFNAWGLGNAHFPDRPGMALVEGGGFDAVGHLGDAYGLRSVFAADLARGNGVIVLAGGSSADPEINKGRYSALARYEERILTALYRHAIVGQRPAT